MAGLAALAVRYLPWLKWAMYAAGAVTIFVGGYQLASTYWKAREARAEAFWAEVERQREQEARELIEENRRKEQEAQAAIDEIARRLVDEEVKLEAITKRSDAVGRRLRDVLAAANSSPAPEGSGPARPVDDPAVLRQLLIELDEMAGASAAAADTYAARLRALQSYADSVSK
jgi:hypothetical protein